MDGVRDGREDVEQRAGAVVLEPGVRSVEDGGVDGREERDIDGRLHPLGDEAHAGGEEQQPEEYRQQREEQRARGRNSRAERLVEAEHGCARGGGGMAWGRRWRTVSRLARWLSRGVVGFVWTFLGVMSF